MLNKHYKIVIALVCASLLSVACMHSENKKTIPNLYGEWKGVNQTVSDAKGYSEWDKTVTISEQKDRRFKGYFEYSEGTINFSGVIFGDNTSFAWTSENSQGYNVGRVLGDNKISACYVESGEQATAGCAELTRTSMR